MKVSHTYLYGVRGGSADASLPVVLVTVLESSESRPFFRTIGVPRPPVGVALPLPPPSTESKLVTDFFLFNSYLWESPEADDKLDCEPNEPCLLILYWEFDEFGRLLLAADAIVGCSYDLTPGPSLEEFEPDACEAVVEVTASMPVGEGVWRV